MGVKLKAAEHGDRVRWDGRMGTIIDAHAKKVGGHGGAVPVNFSVLPDDGPGRLRSWPKVECVVLDDVPKFCPRCGQAGHRAQSCQAEYLAWRERKKQETEAAADWSVDF